MKIKYLPLIIGISLSTLAHAQFKIVAYFPNWKSPKTLVNNIPYSKVTHLNYAFQNPDASGNLTAETNDGLTELVQTAHSNNVKVFVSLCGGAASEDNTMVSRYQDLCSSAKVDGFVQKIVAYAEQYNLDGIDVDIEGDAIKSTYPNFITKLATALHAKNKQITAALSQGYGAQNISSDNTLKTFDWINVMAYDLTGPWDKNNPGQHSPYDWATQQVTYFKGRTGNVNSKVMFGVPFYGYGFGADFQGDEWRYAAILKKYPNQSAQSKDQVGSTIYYNGQPTIRQKTQYAKANAGGIMIWEISNDTLNHPYSLLETINGELVNINENTNTASGITLFPNPANDEFAINGLPPYEKLQIKIYDVAGREVTTFNQYQESYSVKRLEKGIYIASIIVDGSEYTTQKLIVTSY